MRRTGCTFAVALVTAACVAGSAGGVTRPRLEEPTAARLAEPAASFHTSTLDGAATRLLAELPWRGGRYLTASGDMVTVRISAAYAADPGAAQRWADFFSSLVHGPELALLDAYVAPLDEVQTLCDGDGEVLGCYWADKLVTVGDASGGIAPESVAAHEYGHHVAYNRVNPPWVAEDWGTKRWATDMGICSRVADGTAFPGDEGGAYTLNPGEAFAESYRVLNETQAGLPPTWPIVDNSFRPDAAALAALREDVLQPWTAPTTKTIHVRFAHGKRTWSYKLGTPLDGELSARLSTGSADVELRAPGGATVLARGSWTESGAKRIDYRICGERAVVVRVTRGGAGRSFTLRLSAP